MANRRSAEKYGDLIQNIPASARGLTQCAEWQIQLLMEKATCTSSGATLSRDEEDCLDDGFFVCDIAVVERKLQAWQRMFPRVQPYYALKCNPDPVVASVLPAFDCASVAELQLAAASSSTHDATIVYANPQRAEQELEQALRMFPEDPPPYTFDGPEELHKLHRSLQQHSTSSKAPPLLLRLLVPDHDSQIPLGEKFGAPLSEVPSLLDTAAALQLPVVGVSFHCGSGNHDPVAYTTALRIAKEALDLIRQQHTPDTHNNSSPQQQWIVDMGGGYPGWDGAGGDVGRWGETATTTQQDNDAVPLETTTTIARAVVPLLDELFPTSDANIKLIAEPGRYFVEAAFCLCSRIYRVEDRDDDERHLYIAQGVQGVFKDCVLCDETFVPIPLFATGNDDDDNEMVSSCVHGPSGEDFDTICRGFPLPKRLRVGDWLLFDRMGAYTLSIAAVNGRPPIRYVRS